MTKIFTSICLLFSVITFAQQEVIGVPGFRPQTASAVLMKTGDTITLPFRDDFSTASNVPSPTRWVDSKAHINNTFPINQRSRGVATLDGLDEGGKAYNLDRPNLDSITDVLTSKYINLSGANSPYLVFSYQQGGWGESPESGDSLFVDFWNVDSSAWERVWSVNGGGVQNQWDWAAIPATNPKWLKNGFRFRLGIYGAPHGGYDVWNIDYLSMEVGRTPADTVISDPSITKPHPSLLQNFRLVPWFHMGSASFQNQLEFDYRRNGPVPSGGWSLNLGKYRLFQDGNLVASDLTVPVVTNLDHNVDLSFNVNYDPSTIVTPTASTELEMVTWFDGEAVGVRSNDTVYYRQTFDNDYAIDDGSAERVYGLTDADSYLLYQFQPLVSDTLKGFKIFFGQADEDITQTPFKLVVYSFQNGAPGSIIYESDSAYAPYFVGGNNQFGYYPLDTSGLWINGTVYIGLKQLSATPLTVGLDRNTDGGATTIVYGDGLNWYPSQEVGALMLRPYFKYQPSDLSSPEVALSDAVLYPNPAEDWIRFNGLENESSVEVIDLSGKVMLLQEGVTSETILDISSLLSGFYIVRWSNDAASGIEKILIR